MSIITGAHSIIYSKKPEVDRAFMSDVLKLPYIGSGDGWLIFGLPPWQAALHDSAKNNLEEFYLITDDIKALVTEMKKHKVNCSPAGSRNYGPIDSRNSAHPKEGQNGGNAPRYWNPKGPVAVR